VASKEHRPRSSSGAKGQQQKSTLKLVRTEPAGTNGILLVYESHGEEHTWLLEQTSSMEFMALLMQGQFKQGRRVVVEGEVALEPPDTEEERPHLCFTAGPLESCVPLDESALKGLRKDIDRFLSRPA
jgi:hypothetical protein